MKDIKGLREIIQEEARIANCTKCNGDGKMRKYGGSRSVLDYELVNCTRCGGRG